MIITVLAVHSAQADSAFELLRWINELGGVNLRTIVIAATPATDGKRLVDEARRGWGKVEYCRIETPQEIMPWPQGNNVTFLRVCQYMQRHSQPFFFMEPDVLPLRAGWLDELEVEYQGGGRPFMGVIRPLIGPKGVSLEHSDHMNGSGIYPANVLAHLPTAQYLDNVLINQAFDVALRFEMLGQVDGNGGFRRDRQGHRIPTCTPATKICLCWKSYDYAQDAVGNVTCRTVPERGYSPIDWQYHALHHGCKDGSLLNLLRARVRAARGETVPVALAPPIPVVEPPAPASPAAPPAPQKPAAPPEAKRKRGRPAKKKRRPRAVVPASSE